MANILVTDDTKNIRMLLRQCLELEGHCVTTAGSGTEALGCLAHESFDLIFLDVRMPELSGTEVLRQMRRMGVFTPVVMITAFGTVKNAVECTQLGAVTYLQKPFTESKIRQVLGEVLRTGAEPGKVDAVLKSAGDDVKSGRFENAERRLKAALPACFMEPRVYALLAQAYSGMGLREEAEKCRQMARALGGAGGGNAAGPGRPV